MGHDSLHTPRRRSHTLRTPCGPRARGWGRVAMLTSFVCPWVARVRSRVSRPSARALRAQTFSTAQDALVYTILLHGRLVRVPDAPGRTALGPLVAIFDHLISSYS
jgi:hypothetical protein